jgi:hypothetical protein
MKSGWGTSNATVKAASHSQFNQLRSGISTFAFSIALDMPVRIARILLSARNTVPETLIDRVDVRVYQ